MNARMRFYWHALASALLLTGPSLMLAGPVWSLGRANLLAFLMVAFAYLLSVAAATLCARLWPSRPSIVDALLIWLAAIGLVFFFIVMTRMSYMRSALLVAVAAATAALLAAQLLRRFAPVALTGLAVVVLAAMTLQVLRAVAPISTPSIIRNTSIVSTSVYALREREFLRMVPAPVVPGGGIARLGDEYLAATGDGRIFMIDWADQDNLRFIDLHMQVPLNTDAFAAAAPDDVLLQWFRVNDLMVQEAAAGVRIYVSHHFYRTDENCFVLRVSAFDFDRERIAKSPEAVEWRTVFDTAPCLPIIKPDHRGEAFAGLGSGGQMAMLGDDRFLLTVGDFEFDGWNSPEIHAQNEASDYGKTLLVSAGTGRAELFTLGHRNAQGLYVAPSGAIWATEHGPRGGDELNLLIAGKNYGWPMVTYGTDYESLTWPLNATQGRHDDFERPVFAWMPSIGVSGLIGIEKSRFALWQGDLIAASMRERTIYRIEVADGAARFVEAIEIGRPIRDLVEGNDGRILLWTNAADVIVLEPASDAAGGFYGRCSGCHAIGDGSEHGIGPDLRGVFGRRMGSAPGFRYSRAFRDLSGEWTETNLDAFLTNPQSFVPGTPMAISGVDDPIERKAIIDVLRSPQ